MAHAASEDEDDQEWWELLGKGYDLVDQLKQIDYAARLVALAEWCAGPEEFARRHCYVPGDSEIKTRTLVAMVRQDYIDLAVFYLTTEQREGMVSVSDVLAPGAGEAARVLQVTVLEKAFARLESHIQSCREALASIGYDITELERKFILR